MNCEKVHDLLAAYLSGETNKSETMLIRLHLEHCPDCAAELAALKRTKERLNRHFHARLRQTQIPEQVWEQISTKIGAINMNKNMPITHRFNLIKAAATAVMTLIMIAGIVMATVPQARASVEEFIMMAMSLKENEGFPIAAVPEFRPLFPAMMPERLACTLTLSLKGTDQEPPVSEIRHFNKQEFAVLQERPAQTNEPLPDGEALEVNGHPAVLIYERSGTVGLMNDGEESQPDRSPIGLGQDPDRSGMGMGACPGGAMAFGAPESLDYDLALRIVWIKDGIHFNLLSNLSYEEVLAIASSMEPTQPMPPIDESKIIEVEDDEKFIMIAMFMEAALPKFRPLTPAMVPEHLVCLP